jgi:predicted TPR repeat methyltransferase
MWILPMIRICGRAALYNGDNQRADEEYRQAISLQPAALPAWEGLALLQLSSGDVVEAAETYEKLVRLRTSGLYTVQSRNQPMQGHSFDIRLIRYLQYFFTLCLSEECLKDVACVGTAGAGNVSRNC